MSRRPHNPGTWPRLMSAATAAAYLDEVSIEAFLGRVGRDYPAGRHISGRGRVWLKDEIDAAIDRLTGESRQPTGVRDAAELIS